MPLNELIPAVSDMLAQAGGPDLYSRPTTPVMYVASAMLGLSLFLVVSTIWKVVGMKPADERLRGDEQDRRRRLREGDDQYDKFEVLVDELAEEFGKVPASAQERLRVDLTFASNLPWRPAEYKANAAVKGMLVGYMLFGLIGLFIDPVLGLITGGLLGFLIYMAQSRGVSDIAFRKRWKFKKRLPFAVDLMALMLQAGAVFVEALRTVTKESRNHPLGDELQKVLNETEMGRPRRESLESMDKRVNDPDLSELVFAVNRGEELGTKLSDIFSNMASTMRLKRSQWAEKAAGQAQVMIVFPGMLTMLACLLVVTTPFVLKAIYSL